MRRRYLTRAMLDEAEEINRLGDRAGDVEAWEEANRRFSPARCSAPAAFPG